MTDNDMTDLRKAAEEALKLLEDWAVVIDGEWGDCRNLEELEKEGSLKKEILNLRAALEQPKEVVECLCGLCKLERP